MGKNPQKGKTTVKSWFLLICTWTFALQNLPSLYQLDSDFANSCLNSNLENLEWKLPILNFQFSKSSMNLISFFLKKYFFSKTNSYFWFIAFSVLFFFILLPSLDNLNFFIALHKSLENVTILKYSTLLQ